MLCYSVSDEYEYTAFLLVALLVRICHSKDDVMTTHRAYWKVIIANILIALTCIGLIALGVQYATNGHCFYAKTKREKLVDSIEKTTELCLVEKSPGNVNAGCQ